VLVAASLAAYVAYRDVVDGIKTENVSNLLGKSRPPQYTSAMNILVIGSDSRVGTNGQFGSAQAIQGARSDTMMLLHILPGHKGAVVVSFPRDSLVPVIGCQPDGTGTKGQTAQSGESEMLNATFAAGGAACLWKTLETTTGIHIDHFVEINFGGFQSVVNDLGGVNVCLPEAIDDPASHLNLSAGEHHVNGTQALAFVRERHVGEGSDLQRIQRQQYFMAALVQQIESQNVLSSVTKVFAIARDVAKTLTTDSGLSIDDMKNIATSMKGLSTKGVQFTQVPVAQDPTDANRVIWQQPQATALFGEVEHDQAVKPKAAASAKPTASAPAVSPASIRVNVLNASGTGGLAAQTSSALTQGGYQVAGTGHMTGLETVAARYHDIGHAAARRRRGIRRALQKRDRGEGADPGAERGERDVDPVFGVADHRKGRQQVPATAPGRGRYAAAGDDSGGEHDVYRVGRRGRENDADGGQGIDGWHQESPGDASGRH